MILPRVASEPLETAPGGQRLNIDFGHRVGYQNADPFPRSKLTKTPCGFDGWHRAERTTQIEDWLTCHARQDNESSSIKPGLPL